MNGLGTDKKLLSLMRGNNKGAFKIIYQKYWYCLYNTAYRRLRNKQQSEDIVQDIFIRLWERRKELHIDHLAAYLNTAVRYKVYNYMSRDLVSETFYEPFEAIVSKPDSADSLIIEKELLELVDAYIEALPKKRKRIFLLYFDENLSTLEIARRLKVSQKTVQNQLGTAMKGLRERVISIFFCLVVLSSVIG